MTTTDRRAADQKAAQALELLKAGVDIETIAERCGYSTPARASSAMARALTRMRQLEPRAALLLDMARLDQMQVALSRDVRNGDTQSVTASLRIMEQRARYQRDLDRLNRERPEGPTILEQTNESIEAALAKGTLGACDAGLIASLRATAAQYDYVLEHDGCAPNGSLDNVTAPTYLKHCESAGLTPAGRSKLGITEANTTGSRLRKLREAS